MIEMIVSSGSVVLLQIGFSKLQINSLNKLLTSHEFLNCCVVLLAKDPSRLGFYFGSDYKLI